MNELAAGWKKPAAATLGSYFAALDRGFDRRAAAAARISADGTPDATMYEDEFEKIWAAQQKHYPDLLTETLKYGARGKQTFPQETGTARQEVRTLSTSTEFTG